MNKFSFIFLIVITAFSAKAHDEKLYPTLNRITVMNRLFDGVMIITVKRCHQFTANGAT